MIYLWTGTPGSGKTLHAIKQCCEQFAGRPIYVNGLRKLNHSKVDNWIELEDSEVETWDQLPDGSVIFVDEAWRLWPGFRSARGKARGGVSVDAEALRVHRHRGFDFVLTSQHPKDLNAEMRGLVNTHHHVSRPFGLSFVIKQRTWGERCCDDPNDWGEQKDSTVSNHLIPRKYFDHYVSSEMHTGKVSVPWPAYAFLGVIGVLGYLGWGIYDGGLAMSQSDSLLGVEPPSASTEITTRRVESPPGGYLEVEGTTWIPGIGDSYQSKIPVRSFPRPQCLRFGDRTDTCKCYSQQGSRMRDIGQAACNLMVDDGYFDPSVEEKRS